ncbi:hypothetical protein NKR19_g9563 [Coniochaeta hoffmannii]|uniref:Uncharacterized protein n=1 Tax=Coniochaeta hoffmannii TaxID=91930 RepID=A0AA38VB91_9PEZI|nr:hypothetical protein NKR19_g9563 [Coniochaeta hoffmannii]
MNNINANQVQAAPAVVAAPNNPVAVAAPPVFPGQFGPAAAPGAANGPPVLSGQPGPAAAPGVAHGGIWQGNHLAVAANNPFAVAAAAPPVFTGQPNLSAAPAAAPGAAHGSPVLPGQQGFTAAPGIAHGGIWPGNNPAVPASNPFSVAAAAPPVPGGQPGLAAAPAAAPGPAYGPAPSQASVAVPRVFIFQPPYVGPPN